MTKSALEAELLRCGLRRYWQAAQVYVRNAVTLTAQVVDEVPFGRSHLGGAADLPLDWAWPMRGDTPLSLVAQINFADCQGFDMNSVLPECGMLYFFYDCVDGGWGSEPQDRDGFRVWFYDGDRAFLLRRYAPEGWNFPAAALQCGRRWEIPDRECWLMRDYWWEDFENVAWWERWDKFTGEKRHKLLGHSDNIQGAMELQCQLASHGIPYRAATASQLEESFTAGAADWLLLLQIDSDDRCAMHWHGNGRLYVWIRRQDLAARDFSRCWVVLQSA